MEDYKLFLTVLENGEEYKYYCNEEELNENENTKLYCNDDLLSDNYFANNELMITLEKIYKGQLTEYTMSGNMKYNYDEMIKNGFFE